MRTRVAVELKALLAAVPSEHYLNMNFKEKHINADRSVNYQR